MTKFVIFRLELINLFLLLFISLMFAVSCVIPFPVRYYEPLNEGEKIADPSVIGLEYILLFVIHNNIIARTNLYFKDATDDENILKVVMIVPKEQTVRLASNKVEIHSPELSSPVTARVKSIHELKGSKTESFNIWRATTVKGKYGRTEAPPLGPSEELYGYKIKKPSFYWLNFEFINNNQDTHETPQDVTVFLPEIYINDELHKIEPLRFKSTWTVILIPVTP